MTAILQSDFDLLQFADDVVVGDHHAVTGNDEARAEGGLIFARSWHRSPGHAVLKEPFEEVTHRTLAELFGKLGHLVPRDLLWVGLPGRNQDDG